MTSKSTHEELKKRIAELEEELSRYKRTEQALYENEGKYRAILEDIDEGYFEADLSGNFTRVNDEKAHILGYTKKQLVGGNYRQYCDEETARMIRELYNRVYLTGEPFKDVEAMFITRSGKKLFAEFSGALIRDDEGKPAGFRSISRDITRRKMEEEKRRQDAERYRILLEDIEECYFETDLTGRFTFVNDAQCRDLGYTREELIGIDYRMYTHENAIEKSRKIFGSIYKTGQPARYEAEYISKQGAVYTSEVTVSLMRDAKGKPVGFRGLSRNITERIKAQEALLYSEERHRTIMENMQESYFECDLQGRVTFISDMVYRHLGCTRDEVIGSKSKIIQDESGWKKCGWLSTGSIGQGNP